MKKIRKKLHSVYIRDEEKKVDMNYLKWTLDTEDGIDAYDLLGKITIPNYHDQETAF